METIKIELRRPSQKVGNTVRINDEAREVLQDILDEHDVSVSRIVSALIVNCAQYIEFVKPGD